MPPFTGYSVRVVPEPLSVITSSGPYQVTAVNPVPVRSLTLNGERSILTARRERTGLLLPDDRAEGQLF